VKTIWVLLAVSLLFQTSLVFADSEYERGYQWAKEQKLSDSRACSRDLHKNTGGGLGRDFSAGCLDFIIEDALAS